MTARKNPTRPPPIPFDAKKTTIRDSGKNPTVQPPKVGPAPATQQSSGAIRVMSMKTPGSVPAPVAQPQKPIRQVKLRAISEVSPLANAQPQNLGYIAPPRDPAEVRVRKLQDYFIWGSVCVIFASVVALTIWFLAR